jgi:DNA-binding transcriptional MerR regulator/methylmalonyl-CoA mutase cobalamin-binding subunit
MSSSLPRHPIRFVAERTGLTPATLRAWERRYSAVAPDRTPGAQRLYSDADIQRLRLIARLSATGLSLAELARSSTPTLARLARQSLDTAADAEASLEDARANAAVDRMLTDTRALDPAALRDGLTQAILAFGPRAALDGIVSPFLAQVGIAWSCGAATVAQEHLASAAVRDVLGWLMQNAKPAADAPALVASTVADEQHEFGAMMAAAAAALEGWRVIYLGPNLPAVEIAGIAREARARAVLVSVVNPQPTGAVRDELTALRSGIGKRVAVIAGGASATDHTLTMRRASIEYAEHRDALLASLARVWSRPVRTTR